MNDKFCNKDFAVVLPLTLSRHHSPMSTNLVQWLANIPVFYFWAFVGLLMLLPLTSYAANQDGLINPWAVLLKWTPVLLTKGFLMNVVISFFTMAVGTVMGVFLGLGQISLNVFVKKGSVIVTQIFRNSPWLVLLFIVMLSFPFEIVIGDFTIPIPDWFKAVIGLSLPLMANVSEIVRGAVQSVPTGQWEASESLAFSRRQTLWRIILPQTIKRMIPPWMNWYAIMTMATPLVSLLGVTEVVNLSRQAMEAENNDPSLLVPFYGFCLIIFFLYTYPIARLTISLEKRFSVKL
jgi:polar amino acid transport system permease protein